MDSSAQSRKQKCHRHKARLVCKGYAQEEGLDYGETFSLVAKLEGVKILLAYAAYKFFKVYQMDVKSTFLNGVLEEELYIEQLKGFASEYEINMAWRLQKALYGLKQAPRAWYERLDSYLLSIGFKRTSDNSNLYLKSGIERKHLIADFFVDDIIFGGDDEMIRSFAKQMN